MPQNPKPVRRISATTHPKEQGAFKNEINDKNDAALLVNTQDPTVPDSSTPSTTSTNFCEQEPKLDMDDCAETNDGVVNAPPDDNLSQMMSSEEFVDFGVSSTVEVPSSTPDVPISLKVEHLGSLESIKQESVPETQDVVKTNLIVNYLPQHITQEEIRSIFASIGEVESCKVIRDKATCQNLGYGFVNYVNQHDAEKAIATLNGYRLQNKIIKVSMVRPSSESIKGANLYISGLPKSMAQHEFEAMFVGCGKIINARILYDINTGISRRVGFIRFDQRSEAETAIAQLNNSIPPQCTEPITVKFANSPTSTTAAGTNYSRLASSFRDSDVCLSSTPPSLTPLVSACALTVPRSPQISTQDALAMAFMQQFAGYPNNTALSLQKNLHHHQQQQQQLQGDFGCYGSFGSMPQHQLHTGTHVLQMRRSSTELLSERRINMIGGHSPLPPNRNFPAAFTPLSSLRLRFDPLLASPSLLPSQTMAEFPSPLLSCLGSASPDSFLSGNPRSILHPLRSPPPPQIAPWMTLFRPPPPAALFVAGNGGLGVAGGIQRPFCLFVCNLAPEVEEATLWRLFGPFGAVRSVTVAREHNSLRCRGFGFVNMTNYQEACMAIQFLNGYHMGNRILHVTFKTPSNKTRLTADTV